MIKTPLVQKKKNTDASVKNHDYCYYVNVTGKQLLYHVKQLFRRFP